MSKIKTNGKNKMSIEDIAKATGIPKEEIETYS